MFQSFIEEEISIALLFLTSVSCVEIYEIDDAGTRRLAKAELAKGSMTQNTAGACATSTYLCDVNVSTGNDTLVSKSWRILSSSYEIGEAAELLSKRLGYDVAPALKKQKLTPDVAFAMPLAPPNQKKGRLYTFLPLPLSTGFPCHVHALFALTPDRQHLRNSEETGLVEGVDRYVFRLT